MSHPKTTITGILIILTTIGTATISFLKTGVLPDFTPIFTAIAGGWGLIKAADAKE